MQIAIIGCGWLGFPLAKELASNSYKIIGSLRNEERFDEFKSIGIEPFLYDGENFKELNQNIKEANWVVICFPPKGLYEYAKQIESVLSQLKKNVKIIFTSSIGVYPNIAATLNEQSEIIPDHIVYLAEEVIRNSGNPFVILRLAGLIGPNRHPIRFLSGRKIENGTHPVNLIELTDIIEAVKAIISINKINVTYNLCAPEHPNKGEYYIQMAQKMGYESPIFNAETKSKGKLIDGTKITKELDFSYKKSIYTLSVE